MNVFEVVNYFRRNNKVNFAVIHPQLCASDGDNFWRVLLGKQELIDKIVVAGCAPEIQKKMFRWVFKELGFDESKFVGVEIRNMTTEEAIKAIENVL
jgi:heterodisulfide reductase subunit A-like polyferredoxin